MRWKLENFEFNQKTNLLVRSESHEQLEPKTAALLSYFIEHPGKDISRDELIETVWNSQIVSDSAINRAVVNLRKALGDTEKVKRFIVTVPKVGYRFVCNAQEIHEQTITSVTTDFSKTKKKPTLLNMSFAILLMFALGLVLNQLIASAPQTNNINVSPIIRLPGVQFGVEQSYSGEMLAYSQRMPDGSTEIHLSNNGTAKPEVISLRGGHASLSHWSPDDHRLVYKFYTDKICQLHIVEFRASKALAPKPLYECESGLNLLSVAFSPDQTKLFFTERDHKSAPFIAYELDLESGSKQRLPQPFPTGFGNYHIDVGPKAGRLLLLSKQKNEQTNVFELNQTENTYSRLIELDYELRSAVWSHGGNSIVHPGRHPSHHLIETFFDGKSRVLVPDSRRIGGIKRINNDRDYLFGTYLGNHNITVNGKDVPHLNSSDRDYIPTYSRDGKRLAFISRRTGSDKLWIKDLRTEGLSSIDIPNVSRSFSSIDWSFDDNHIAINSSNGILLVNILTGQIEKSPKTKKATYAVTWDSSSSFTYSQFEESQWRLYRYDLANDQTDVMDERWAFALTSKERLLFIDQSMRLFQDGVTEINSQNCSMPIHDYALTFRLVGQDLYCIDKADETRLRIFENLHTSRLLDNRIEAGRYYSVTKDNIASFRFVRKTSDIMRTNIDRPPN